MKIIPIIVIIISFSLTKSECKNDTKKKCECGIIPNSTRNARIFRGIDATIDSYPWYVVIELRFFKPPKWLSRLKDVLFGHYDKFGEFMQFSGALVTRRHILTAAHGFYDINFDNPSQGSTG